MQNQNQIFNPTHESRYEPQQQQNYAGNPNVQYQQDRQNQIKSVQNELKQLKNSIYNSQQKQDFGKPNIQGQQNQQNNGNSPGGNKFNQQSYNKPLGYYQSQLNGQDNVEMQSYQSNNTQNYNQQQQQALSFYGLNKNSSNPFNQNVNAQDLQNHKNEAISHYYNPQNAQAYNNFNGQLKYQGVKNTGFSYDDFESKQNKEFNEKIYKVMERDYERSRLGTHPHQLKQKEEMEKQREYNLKQQSLGVEELNPQKLEEEKLEKEQYDNQIIQLKRLLHNHRLISFSGTTLQITLYFFMYFMTSNNKQENDLAQQFTSVHALITVYFLLNQFWNFNIYKRVYYDFEQITNSWFTSFMLAFSFLNVIVYLLSCVYYIFMFSRIKGDTDNMETILLNYFVILISTVNIFQLLYSTYTTWMVRYPPKNHQYYILD